MLVSDSTPAAVNPISWGVVGLGHFATGSIAPAMQRSNRAVLTACATRDPARAAAFAERFAVPNVYDRFEDLVRDPEIDAVFVATPNALHVPVVVAAAAAGKHVFCEKPLALSLDEGRKAVRACEEAEVILRLGLHLRLERSLRRVGEILREGMIGRVCALSIERAAPISERVPWRTDPAQGGSILYDVGVHLLDLVPRLLQTEIASVAGFASPPPNEGASADTITILARLADGVQATIRMTREAPYSASDLVVIGTEGMLRTGPLRWVDTHHISIITAVGLTEEIVPTVDLYREEIDAFAEDVADGGERLATGKDGLKLIVVADAVQRVLR